jgi:endonuclease/exonuclease/phosphatase family metal-dependent hydrolase
MRSATTRRTPSNDADVTWRLLSYNIRYGGTGRETALSAVIAAARPDVVVLQEATDPRVVARLAAAGEFVAWGSRPGYSTGFLSRIPVAHHAWHHPRASRHAFLEIALEGTDVRVFGLHLSAWFSKWSERRRAREIRALLDGIREHQHGFHLIAGDFNALAPGELLEAARMPRWIRAMVWLSGRDIERDTIQVMLDEGYVDAWRTLHPGDPGYTFPTWDPHVRLDYVFTHKRYAERLLRCEVVREPAVVREASDHLPLVVEVGGSP